jgi:DNA-binding SARP family transcriptional activator/ATP/maltotriose-dependent transcriptional regulator MalT
MSVAWDVDPRSSARVHVALTHRLTLVVAAPGWGKTTLLRTLASAAPAVEVARPPAGWTPFTLARQLVAQLVPAALVDDLLPTRLAPDSDDHVGSSGALAAAVCAAAATAITDDTLVLDDDADLGAADPLRDCLEALVMHVPAQLHLVLASRRSPPLRVGRLRAAGEVARITESDRAIDASAIDGLGPDERTAVDAIAAATGGWPLAVRLAAEVGRRGGPLDHAAIVDRLLDPEGVLFEFLAEEVLAAASDGERELLALAAHLPFVDTELLAWIGRDRLGRLLPLLGRAATFLERDPAVPERYRATLVGGEFARRALPAPAEDVIRLIVTRLCDRGDADQVLETCLQLGDPGVAREVVLTVPRPDLLGRAIDDVLALAASASDDTRLAELRGDVHYLRGSWDEAVAAYDDAARLGDATVARLARKRATLMYQRGRLDDAEATCAAARLDGSDPAEESRVLSWRAAIRWVRGDVAGCRELVDAALALGTAAGDDAALATAHTTRGMLAALAGDRHENAEAYRVALHHAERAGDVVQIVRIRSNRGSLHMEEGQYQEALRELDAAIELADLVGADHFGALAYSNRGDTYRRLGRLDDALDDLRRAEAIWQRLGSGLVHYAVGLLGDVQALRGQRREAIALYRQAIELADAQGDTQGLLPGLIGLARTLAADDPAAAMDAAQRAIDTAWAMSMAPAHLAAGWIELRRADTVAAADHAACALRFGRQHQDRPAVAEAMLLQAVVNDPPDAALAEESRRLSRDLGNRIGEARAALVVAQTLNPSARDAAVAAAEQLLVEAGAWGVLADAREARPEPAAAPVVIVTLGGFRVSRHTKPVEVGEWGSRKARDLLKLLVARRGAPVVREEVTELLWPDEPDRSARRLSVLLSTIRSVLDPTKAMSPDHYIAADHDTVWLVREHVEIDVELFLRDADEGRRLLAAGDVARGEQALTRAASRYLGDFCADDPYADWAAGTREIARHTFVELAAELGRLADERAQHGAAVRHRLRILDVDPYDEAAHLDLVRSLSAQRRHGEARRAYRTYCTRLAELGLEPAPFP